MSSVVNRTDDVNKYSVCAGSLYVMSSHIDSFIVCCCKSLHPMEGPCFGHRPASPCSIWAGEFMDFRIQSICGYVARHRAGGIVGQYSRILCFLPSLTSSRSTPVTAISLTTSCRLRTSVALGCLLITLFLQTQISPCLVSASTFFKFCYLTVS